MQKKVFNINVISIVLMSLVLLIGLWNFTIFYLPILIIMGIIMIVDIFNNHKAIPISIAIILFFFLLLHEVVNFTTSSYQANSILFLRDYIAIFSCILLLNNLTINKKYKVCLIVIISLIAGLFAFLNIPIFFIRYYESAIYGFSDFTQFRYLYRPLGFLSNEWVTILFCFFPFPLIGLLLFWKKKLLRFIFFIIIILLVFNILVSFSRAASLSFLILIILLNILVGYYRLLPIKKILYSNIAILFSLFLFAFFFSESIKSTIQPTHSHQRSSEGRLKQWDQSMDIVDSSPYFGIGSKNYALFSHSQQVDLELSFNGRVNNTYAQLFIEKGWLGFTIWSCIIGYLTIFSFLQIRKSRERLDKAINCVIFSVVFAILFREIFFSSLFCNSGLLLLFLFLLIFNNNKALKILIVQKIIIAGVLGVFIICSVYFYIKKPDNALTYAEKGLRSERSIKMQPFLNLLDINSDTLTKAKFAITTAIDYYKKANRLSSHSDAMFHHNIGWLYWMIQQPDSALIYLSKAVELEPNTALYHISKGLLIEFENPENALRYYSQAVLLSPDIIDSPFFIDLKKRKPIETRELLEKATAKLELTMLVKYSSIIEAKKSKLLLSLGKTDEAYKALINVTNNHPNLNRPWYYLGVIEYERGNIKAAERYYRKSLYLSPNDHLPLYTFATYYKENENQLQYKKYSIKGDKSLNNKQSTHSKRCKYLYSYSTVNDDIIPKGLLDYITPVYQK